LAEQTLRFLFGDLPNFGVLCALSTGFRQTPPGERPVGFFVHVLPGLFFFLHVLFRVSVIGSAPHPSCCGGGLTFCPQRLTPRCPRPLCSPPKRFFFWDRALPLHDGPPPPNAASRSLPSPNDSSFHLVCSCGFFFFCPSPQTRLSPLHQFVGPPFPPIPPAVMGMEAFFFLTTVFLFFPPPYQNLRTTQNICFYPTIFPSYSWPFCPLHTVVFPNFLAFSCAGSFLIDRFLEASFLSFFYPPFFICKRLDFPRPC